MELSLHQEKHSDFNYYVRKSPNNMRFSRFLRPQIKLNYEPQIQKTVLKDCLLYKMSKKCLRLGLKAKHSNDR